MLDLNMVWYQSTINVIFVESLRIVANRLEFALEERLLADLVSVASTVLLGGLRYEMQRKNVG